MIAVPARLPDTRVFRYPAKPISNTATINTRSGQTLGTASAHPLSVNRTAPFTQKSTMDDTYADITLGVDTLSVNGTVLRVSYAGQFSENSEFHSASMKLSFPF